MNNRERMMKRKNENKKLTKCRTCNNPISKNAATCPHCGDISPLPSEIYGKRAIEILIATIIGIIFIYYTTSSIMGNMQENMKKIFDKNKNIKTPTTFVK